MVPRTQPSALVRALLDALGGRFSRQMGIDVDGGPREIERWFLAATLFGTRISWRIVERTHAVFDAAGVRTIADVGGKTWDEIVALLDAGGYARYDFRTATRLQQLAATVGERYGGHIVVLEDRRDPAALERELDALPGWGPVTVRVFLRELRGVWPGARPPIDERALSAARHLGLTLADADPYRSLAALARGASMDVRDLESVLVRLRLDHGFGGCPGSALCRALALTSRPRRALAPRPPASRSRSSPAR
jgi:hypothetical protein